MGKMKRRDSPPVRSPCRSLQRKTSCCGQYDMQPCEPSNPKPRTRATGNWKGRKDNIKQCPTPLDLDSQANGRLIQITIGLIWKVWMYQRSLRVAESWNLRAGSERGICNGTNFLVPINDLLERSTIVWGTKILGLVPMLQPNWNPNHSQKRQNQVR